MNSNTIFITLIYFVGIASCAAQGAEKGKYQNYIPVLHYLANAFGGGFMRDIILLGVHPWILTLSALPDIVLVILIGCLYTYYFLICKAAKKQYNIAIQLVALTDAFGLGSFICIGMDKAFEYSDNVFTIITCGYVTAVGGGLLASGKLFTLIFRNKKTICYHLVTLLGCCYYYIFRHSLFLVFFVASGIFLTSIDYKNLYFLSRSNVITAYPSIFLLYEPIYGQSNNYFQKQNIRQIGKKLGIYPICPKLYLIQHRIRQC